MNEIPATFWMFIIGGLAVCFGAVLVYVALLIRDLGETVRESTKLVKNSNGMITEAEQTVRLARETLTEVKINLIDPLLQIGTVIKSVTGFAQNFGGRKRQE